MADKGKDITSNTYDAPIKPIPDDIYQCEVTEVTFTDSGVPRITYKILNEGKFKGRTVISNVHQSFEAARVLVTVAHEETRKLFNDKLIGPMIVRNIIVDVRPV